MNDETLRDMVIAHDKILEMVGKSVETITTSMVSMNAKLEKLTEEIAKQNVLVEKVNVMEKKVEDIEKAKNGDGCNALRFHVETTAKELDKLKTNSKKIEDIDNELPKKVSYKMIGGALVLLVPSLVGFGSYLVLTIHKLQNTYVSKEDIKPIRESVQNIERKMAVYDTKETHYVKVVTDLVQRVYSLEKNEAENDK